MMCLLSAVTTKQQAVGVTDWSNGSPSCRLCRPVGVTSNKIKQHPHYNTSNLSKIMSQNTVKALGLPEALVNETYRKGS